MSTYFKLLQSYKCVREKEEKCTSYPCNLLLSTGLPVSSENSFLERSLNQNFLATIATNTFQINEVLLILRNVRTFPPLVKLSEVARSHAQSLVPKQL